ncbi:hypothetical protein IV53_GL001247 [Ligilactobacillus ceti DSM 22408]|uniref:Gram-positive cocci surface proteins LPxTG domain-containing protein n=1 Tax=Ligilactobacillus ceti DSM 22408 TaxID=1122146 RepID=A0A0R2KJM7_9LACO|nr:hypothetical protein IV53_GL001247 [Ligilactobacillus ceti DSM 22408]
MVHAGNTTLRTTLQIVNLDDNDQINHDTEFWVGHKVPAAADCEISGSGASIKQPWLRLTVPKSADITSPTFIDSQKAQQTIQFSYGANASNAQYEKAMRLFKQGKKYVYDYQGLKIETKTAKEMYIKLKDAFHLDIEHNYYVLYMFDELAGGARVTFPFPFEVKIDPTNNGDTLTVKFDMLGGTDHQKVLYKTEKTYKFRKTDFKYNYSDIRAYNPDSREPLNSGKKIDTNTNCVNIYDVNVDEGAKTTGKPGKDVWIYWSPTVLLTKKELEGVKKVSIHRPKNLKTVVHLPKGVSLADKAGKNWQWNEKDRTMTLITTKTGASGPDWRMNDHYGQYYCPKLLFTDIPFGKIVDLPVEYYVDAGLPTERALPKRVAHVKFRGIEFKKKHGLVIYKDNLNSRSSKPFKYWLDEGKYTILGDQYYDKYGDSQNKHGLFYVTHLKANNNGSSLTNKDNGIVEAVSSVIDVLETRQKNKLYYYTYEVASVEPNGNLSSQRGQELKQEVIKQINSKNVLYGIKEDGSKEVIAKNIKYQQKITIDDKQRKYVKLSLEFEKPLILNNMNLQFYTGTQPTKQVIQDFKDRVYKDRQTYYGQANLVHKSGVGLTQNTSQKGFVLTTDSYSGGYGYTSLEPLAPRAYVTDSGNQTVAYSSTGTYLTYRSDVRFNWNLGNWGPLSKKPVKNVKVIQLLPPAFKYHKVAYKSGPTLSSKEPTIIQNFKNTGRTAVIYDVEEFIPDKDGFKDLDIRTEIEATPQAERGNNLIETFVVYPDNDIIKPYISNIEYIDKLDLNNNGDRNEILMRAKSYINYIPPLELITSKRVGYTAAADNMGLMATGDLGYSFYYELKVYNNTIADAKNAYVIDTFPFVGDHSIAPNQKGIYTLRQSKFATPLVKALEDIPANKKSLERFAVYYQLVPQGKTFKATRDGKWLTKDQVKDFSQVKSIKLELKPGQVVKSKTEVRFVVECKIPYDKKLIANQDTAVNSVAISTDGTIYSEGNTVSVNYTKYEVSGTIFKDLNKDGLMRADEDGVARQKLQLIDVKTGKVAKDYQGNDIPATTTDENGHYHFEVFRRGQYAVRFVKTAQIDMTKKNYDHNVKASNAQTIKATAATSYEFELSPMQPTAIENFGIVSEKRNVKLLKVSSELTADQSGKLIIKKPLLGAKFTLINKNDPKINFEATTDVNGQLEFKDVPFGRYILKEVKAPTGFEQILNQAGQEIVVSDKPLAQIEIKNKPIKRDVSLKKIDTDTHKPLAGVEFGIFEKDLVTNKVATKPIQKAKSNLQGLVEFKDIAYGSYIIKELTTLPGYVLNHKDIAVTIDQPGKAVINLGEVTNEKIKADVKVTKVDADTKEKLAGVEFGIFAKDDKGQVAANAWAIEKTNDQGVAIFKGVPFGEYVVKEITPKQGYLLSQVTKDVKISNATMQDLGEVTNEKIKGQVEITKVDQADPTKLLEKAVFTLTNQKDPKIVFEATTNAQGKAIFNDVPYGKYQLTEKTAPIGYNKDRLDKKLSQIEIKTNQQVIRKQVKNAKITGTVKFIKVDQDHPTKTLAGVGFELQQNGQMKYQANSNAKGVVEFKDVAYGVYDLVEVKTLPSYKGLPKQNQAVQITTQDQVVDLGRVANQIKKGQVKLVKVDQADPTIKLAGVEFGLYQKGQQKYHATTNAQGEVIFSGVEYGKYQLKEIKTLENYNLSKVEKTINIDADQKIVDLGQITNRLKMGQITIKKVDIDTKEKLAGVTFALFHQGQKIAEDITNQNGQVTFNNVVYGNYVVKEIKTLENYVLSPTEYQFAIREDGKTLTKEVTNRKIKADIIVNKVDQADPQIKIAGTVFGLFQKDREIARATTDQNGQAHFKQIPYGKYELKEIVANEAYNLTNEVKVVEVKKDQEIIQAGEFKNTMKKGTVKFVKVDRDNHSKVLSGVEFELQQNGKTKYRAVSDENGVVEFKDVVYGKYQLKEMKTVKGYILPTEIKEVVIMQEGQVVDLGLITNQKEPIKAQKVLPKTGETQKTVNILWGILGLVIAGGMLLFRRKLTA